MVKASSATSGDLRAMLNGGFDFQHKVSYWCAMVAVGLKHSFLALGASDERTDRWTNGGIIALLYAVYTFGGGA